MKLTDNLCRTAKANGRYQDFSDPGTPLTFRVKVNGEKLFLWRGRIGGKQTQRVIGSYPVNRRANGTPYRRAKGTPLHDGARFIGHAPLRCARR